MCVRIELLNSTMTLIRKFNRKHRYDLKVHLKYLISKELAIIYTEWIEQINLICQTEWVILPDYLHISADRNSIDDHQNVSAGDNGLLRMGRKTSGRLAQRLEALPAGEGKVKCLLPKNVRPGAAQLGVALASGLCKLVTRCVNSTGFFIFFFLNNSAFMNYSTRN